MASGGGTPVGAGLTATQRGESRSSPLPQRLWHILPGLVLGALSVAGFAPLEWFPLTGLALAGLFALWRRNPKQAPPIGYAYGLGLFLAGASWIYVSLSRYGGMASPLAALAVLLFAAVLALFPMGAGWIFRRLSAGRCWQDVLLAAGAWTLTEWLRTWIFTGFPWLIAGYSQTPPSPLAGYAPLLGVIGLTLLLALCAALPVFAWGETGRLRLALAGMAALLLGGFGLTQIAWTTSRPAPVSFSLLQGNVEQSLKWRPELLYLSLDRYLDLARRHPAQVLVLPETALPLPYERLPADYVAALRQNSPELVLGTVYFDAEGRVFNAAVANGKAGGQRYAKSHLVPFGEYTPPLFQWTLRLLSIPMSDFSSGGAGQKSFDLAGEKVAADICYEDAFGAEIAAALPEATILLNLSNTAWFGDSLAQSQHLQMSRMRALETGRPMLRATNTGMTAAIGARGEILGVLPPFVEGALTVSVHGREGMTPYARWRDWPAVLLAAAMLLLPALSTLHPRSSTSR